MVQELMDLATGRVWRRTLPDGEWSTARGEGDTVPLSAGGTGATDVEGAIDALGLASLKGNGPYVRSTSPSTLRVWTGAKVVTFSDSWSTIFTGSQLSSLLGRAFDFTRDVVLCYNADNSATKGYMFATAAHSDGTVRVYARIWGDYTGTCKGAGRVNWVLIAP